MKKLLLLLFTLSAVYQVQAQFNYTFAASNQAYQPLTGTTSINGSTVWDEESYAVPLGFSFKLDGLTISKFNLMLGPSVVGVDTTPVNDITGFVYGTVDLADRGYLSGSISKSPVRYVVTGTAPNRIFKAELFNAGFYDELDIYGTMTDSVNIQAWLYETSNILEFRYGGSKISHPQDYYQVGSGPIAGLVEHFDFGSGGSGKGYILTGNPVTPSLDSFTLPFTNLPPTLNNWPPSGTVYKFTPKSNSGSGVGQIPQLTTVSVYPTNAVSLLHVAYIDRVSATYAVTDAAGRQLQMGSLGTGVNDIDVSHLPAGIYLLQVQSAKGNGVYRFVKE